MSLSKLELQKLGAQVRLEEINRERDYLLDFLGYQPGLAQDIIKTVKKIKKANKKQVGGGPYNKRNPHWMQMPKNRARVRKMALLAARKRKLNRLQNGQQPQTYP